MSDNSVPETLLGRALDLLGHYYQPVVVVIMVCAALVLGAKSTFETSAKAAATSMDERIQVTPNREHEQRLTALENQNTSRDTLDRKRDEDMSQVKGDIKVIRTIIELKFGSPKGK